jgi:hypothetical protein
MSRFFSQCLYFLFPFAVYSFAMVNIPIHITAKAIRYSLKLSTLAEYNASITLTMAGKHKPIVPLLGSNLYPSL